MKLHEYYQENTVDKYFDELAYQGDSKALKEFCLPCLRFGFTDKHRLFYHYIIHHLPARSNDIESFWERNTVPEDFDAALYSELNPSCKFFYKDYCNEKGISEEKRLYYHSLWYGSKRKTSLNTFLDTTTDNLQFLKFEELSAKPLEQLLSPHDSFLDSYRSAVAKGKEIAENSKIAIVGLARDCRIKLENSLTRLRDFKCKEKSFFFFENDSVDGTDLLLENLSSESSHFHFKSVKNARPYRKDRSNVRTEALSEYRNICRDWVAKNCSDYDYTLVLDADADLGFSVDGIYNSIGWLSSIKDAGGLGSYSFFLRRTEDWAVFVHYDSFAVRVNDWLPSTESKDFNNAWFKHFHPLIGSPPIPFYSCFGGLAVYRNKAFLCGEYSNIFGCEHVAFHKAIRDNGYNMYLNPSSLFFAEYRDDLNEDASV